MPADTLALSVRQLVEFTCRRGDLLSSAAAGPSAQEGIKAHSRLQKQRPAESLAEYPVEVTIERRGYRLRLGGRLDLLHPQHTPPLLEEIKTTYSPPAELADSQRFLHWSQLKVYGYCYLRQHNEAPATLDLGMVWYDLLADRVHRQQQTADRAALEAFCLPLIDAYLDWHELIARRRAQMLDSAARLAFPFPDYRRGQRQLAVAVFRSLRDSDSLLAEAPTGIGKTVSSVFPAVKVMGEKHIDQVTYLTAKKQGRAVVADCLALLRRGGLQMTALVLQAKNDICECRNGGCERDGEGNCPLLLGFYDRLPTARRALLEQDVIDSAAVRRSAAEHRLCPFELSLQLLPWVQFVVADFNYVFDPLVGLTYFRDSGGWNKELPHNKSRQSGAGEHRIGLLVDEAHNLVERSRDMYSVQFSRADVQRIALLCKSSHPRLERAVKGVARAISRWAKPLPAGTSVTAEKPQTLTRAVEKVKAVIDLLSQQGVRFPDAFGEWVPEIYRYLKVDALEDTVYRTVTERQPARRGDICVTRKCLDASRFLTDIYARFHGGVLFSGTLRPAFFFRRVLGLQPQTGYLTLPSPFTPDQQGVFVCEYIDTRYRHRAAGVEGIVLLIAAACQSRRGNYLVFFPSYQYLDQVFAGFVARYPDTAVVRQAPAASDASRARFLAHFEGAGATVGFAITGGIYGEAVDYVGDRLTGVIAVGVGLPQINPQRQLIRDYYQGEGLDGFDYAYRYPGMTRVLQTAGRVIRRETDRGIILLADHRFSEPFYRHLFPGHWHPQRCRDQTQLEAALAGFWCDDSGDGSHNRD
ncbi:ATP-dependent DNA helicase [Exilibacterium tricleocarpae]|uniref:ATP-dependent DNA helicase n=1 Tax=Exilibacterium tricleocarpae TaxID=2591008 RepID=A0A545SYR5_9GAMM|nr:ATP-dependent DNA helicase [Exilibacterium tricleocarpae]TQV70111.1 ATP-dependent DNA helicase [Exilibacterium tricleocarpae]